MTTVGVSVVETLDCVVHEPPEDADAVIIWMHGLGASANDFVGLPFELGLAHTRFIFPNAPSRPVTVNGGMVMPAWYDFLSFEFSKGEDVSQLRQSMGSVELILEQQLEAGIEASRIVIGGFSQGGAVALGLAGRPKWAGKLGGVVGWSTYYAEQLGGDWATYPPLLMAHGLYDSVIPLSVGRSAKALLAPHAKTVEWHEYPMEHRVCVEEITDLKHWLNGVGLR